MLHGACANLDGRALAFLGVGGNGKSTTVAGLVASGRGAFVADDCLAVDMRDDGVSVRGADDAQQWLTRDARRWLNLGEDGPGKAPVPPPSAAPQTIPLAALFCLSFEDSLDCPVLRRAKPGSAFRELSLAQIRFALDDPRVWLRDFEALSFVLARIPVYELVRPRNLARLTTCLDLIEAVSGGIAVSTSEN